MKPPLTEEHPDSLISVTHPDATERRAFEELREARKRIAAMGKALHCCCYTEPCARPEICGAYLSSTPMCCNCHPSGCMCEVGYATC